MDKSEVVFHMFANGFGIIDFPFGTPPDAIGQFREWWDEHKDDEMPMVAFGGMTVRVVEHPMPFGRVEYSGELK